jgi:hypothetical protein
MRIQSTPRCSSWLLRAEIWFSKIEGNVKSRENFILAVDLQSELTKYIPKPPGYTLDLHRPPGGVSSPCQ